MKIIKNYLYNVANQLITIIIPLATIPYISRVLGPSGVGINAYTNSIISYFILFGGVGIGLYGNRTIAYLRDNKLKMSKVFWEITLLRAVTVFLAYLFFIAFLFVYKEYHTFLLLQSISLIAVIFDISWLFMGLEDFKKTVIRNILVKIVSLIAIFTFVKESDDTWIYILILVLSVFLGNLVLWGYLKKTVVFIPLKRLSPFKHLKSSILFFIPQIAIQIYVVLNKTMLGAIVDVDQVALYDNAYKLIMMILSLITAIGTVVLPALTNKVAQKQNEQVQYYFKLVFHVICFLAFPLAFALCAMSKDLSPLFFGTKFIGINLVISFLSPVIIFIAFGVIFGQYFSAINKIKFLTIAVSVGALINFILNWYFIYFYGATGAAISTVITELLVTLIQFYFIKKLMPVTFLNGIWKYIISAIMMFGAMYFISDYYDGFVSLILQFIIGCIIYLMLIWLLNPILVEQAKLLLQKRTKKDLY